MKTKTNFATTSDVRNLINATVETLPKGPERDGIQTKMFNFWDNYNAGNNLPEGSDRKRFLAEAIDNKNAGLRIARTLVNKDQKFSGVYYKVTDLISKLAKIKVGKNEMAKVEDNFYGKRVVKGIFAKAKFDKSNYYALEGTVDGNATGSKTVETIEEAMYYGKAMLEHMKKQSPKAKVATVHIFKVVNYERENKPVKVLNSRTGSKARFANEEIAKGLSKVLKANGFTAMASEVLSGSTDSETLRKYIRALKSKMSPLYGHERPTVLLEEIEKRLASRTGVKAKFANGGTKTAAFLAKIDSKSKAMILENIAKNYGISAQAALAEVTDSESENLLDYMTEPARSAASVLMQKYGSFSRTGAKAKFASHPSWSEGILGKETNPKLAAYSWISKNNIESGRRQMLLADLAAGMYENNKSLSIAQAVLAAAKDMVRKGVATTEIQQWAANGGKFSRTGVKAFK